MTPNGFVAMLAPTMVPGAIGMWLVSGAIAVLTIVVHALLAWAVFQDAKKLAGTAGRLFLLTEPLVWGLVTLVTGVIGFVAYWLVHYSTLGPQRKDSP